MARISTYPIDTTVALTDTLLGTDEANAKATKNYAISDVLGLVTAGITVHADNAAAVTAGLAVGTIYRTDDVLKVVH